MNFFWRNLVWLSFPYYLFLVITGTLAHGERVNDAFSLGRPETRSALEETSSFERRGRRSRQRWPMLDTWQLNRESIIDGKWQERTLRVPTMGGTASALSQNVTQKVTSAMRQHLHSLRQNQTTLIKDSVMALSFVTLFQVVKTTLVNPSGLLRQTISSAVPLPTRMAWKQIAQVIGSLQAETHLRVWTQYSPHIVWQSLKAIRKLQRALPKEQFSEEIVLDESKTQLVAKDLAYYSVYATLAYGWPMALARMAYGWPKWRGGGSLQTLLQQTGLTESNIIEAVWQAKDHRPAYLLVQDPYQKAIVLTIRGTWSASDIMTDMCCTTTEMSPTSNNDSLTVLWQWLRPRQCPTIEAHHGMVQAALALHESLYKHVEVALKDNPDYRLVLVGHSMGGGCAALLGLLWEKDFHPVVYVYGPPCVAPFESPLTHHGQIHSVVLPGDPFCTLSLGHVAELAATVDYFAKHDDLRKKICRRSVSSGYATEIWNVLDENVWSKRRQKQVGRQDSADDPVFSPKLVPPGNVWRLVRQSKTRNHLKKWRLELVSTHEFLSLSIQPFAMDLTRHVPALYEACLRQSYS